VLTATPNGAFDWRNRAEGAGPPFCGRRHFAVAAVCRGRRLPWPPFAVAAVCRGRRLPWPPFAVAAVCRGRRPPLRCQHPPV